MYTRNLIGSVTVSASVLEDLNNKIGFWFVLQDLSVRTEGNFRYSSLLLLGETLLYPFICLNLTVKPG